MKNLIGLLMIGAVVLGVYKLWELYDQQSTTSSLAAKDTRRQEFGAHLQGLDQRLEQPLREAYSKGLLGLKGFLQDYRSTQFLQDPRLAWIEIDYAVMLVNKDAKQARTALLEVRDRLQPNSPAMPHLKEFEGPLGLPPATSKQP